MKDTAKEKALELIEWVKPYCECYSDSNSTDGTIEYDEGTENNAIKSCATMSAEIIRDELKDVAFFYLNKRSNASKLINNKVSYWNDVLKEIESYNQEI